MKRHENGAESHGSQKRVGTLTQRRRGRIESVLDHRTDQIRLILQDIHHPHNVSACLRSADAFGIQNVDVVTLGEKFKPSTVAKGVVNWLSITRFSTVEQAAEEVRASGYKIACAMPGHCIQSLNDLPRDQPLALLFGNERRGIDKAWNPHIDYMFTISTVGMVESLNISVAVAISLHYLTTVCSKESASYFLDKQRKQQLLETWLDK
jgi:tRNA (guanosine-2'-O-)-methyltransferase